jgi:hypothetical protein
MPYWVAQASFLAKGANHDRIAINGNSITEEIADLGVIGG